MSFGFRATDEIWQGERRELRAVDLVEISIVQAFPAYEGTTIAARSRAGAKPRLALAKLHLAARGAM
jgi:phage head maturation protease